MRTRGIRGYPSPVCPRGPTHGLAATLIAATIVVTACGSGAPPIPRFPKGHVPPLTNRTALPARHSPGSTVTIPLPGTTMFVTVRRVIDPLGGSGAKVPAGTVPVGVLIAVRNGGPESYDSSATSDFSLVTASGPAIPVFAPAGVCQTYVQDFMNEIGAGQTRTGCISYAVPHGRTPTAVRFTPYGGREGRAVTWQLGPPARPGGAR